MDINFPVQTSICTIHVEGFTSELPSSVHVFLVFSVFFFLRLYMYIKFLAILKFTNCSAVSSTFLSCAMEVLGHTNMPNIFLQFAKVCLVAC